MGLFNRPDAIDEATPARYELRARHLMNDLKAINLREPGVRRLAAQQRLKLLQELDEQLDAYNLSREVNS